MPLIASIVYRNKQIIDYFVYCNKHYSVSAVGTVPSASVTGGAFAVNAEEDCKKDGEAPKGGASVAEEREGDSYHGSDSQYHSYINK